MHHLGHYYDALSIGAAMVEAFGAEPALMGALSTLAMDAEQPDLARHYASLAGDHPEGLITTALFAVQDGETEAARAGFEAAIAATPKNARAWIGLGLTDLAEGRPESAARAMETGAGIFGDHLGSWVGAGWAWYVAGNLNEARRCFEWALAMDDSFAETHGGLAVLAMAEGRREDAARHAEVARRLAKGDVGSSLGAALAEAMRLTEEGQEDAAKALVQRALGMVLGRGG